MIKKQSAKKQSAKKQSAKKQSRRKQSSKMQSRRKHSSKKYSSKKGGEQEKKMVKRAQKEIDDTIIKHLVALKEKLGENTSFWTFPDDKKFKKLYHGELLEEIQDRIKKDVDKYKNRKIAEISICPRHKASKNTFVKHQGIWLTARIIVFGIDVKGKMQGRNNFNNSCSIRWEEEDFLVSKLSLKLLEKIMYAVAEDKHSCLDMYGISLHKVVNDLKKKNIDISDDLSPLKGIKKYKKI
jgi:hypothetical protein